MFSAANHGFLLFWPSHLPLQTDLPQVAQSREVVARHRQHKRKLIEQGFGWAKTVGHMRQVLVRGIKKVDQMFVLTMAGYNLTRLRNLGQIRPQGQM